MIQHNINPILLDIPGPFEIRWYGLMYLLAFVVLYIYAKSEIKKGKLELSLKQLDQLLGWQVVGMIIFARIFYILFYNLSYYLTNPLKTIAIWEGGLSFHGGALGIVLVTIYFVKKYNVSFFNITDTFVIPLALGNALGRFGNFINAEIYGVATKLPWGVQFPGIDGVRHPTQIYAVIYNIVIFVILFATRRQLKNGQTLGLFFLLYSAFRFINEYFKDMVYYYGFTMGQWLTIPLFFLGLYLLFRTKFKNKDSLNKEKR